METEKQRIEELVKQLNAASAAYYNGQDEIMPNYEWDALFDELTTLEEKTGYIIKDSPTQNAGYEESGSGQKEPHEYPALSLAKTKQVEELQQWAGVYPIWLSWKLDGLTLVLTYDNGNLVKILTRGNGNQHYIFKGCYRRIPAKDFVSGASGCARRSCHILYRFCTDQRHD